MDHIVENSSGLENNNLEKEHHHEDEHNHEGHNHDGHNHDGDEDESLQGPQSTFEKLKIYLPAAVSLILLLSGILLGYQKINWFNGTVKLVWFVAAYLPVAYPVLMNAFKSIIRGDFFTEFFLMGIATLGAFYLGEYAEGVAVMLFYAVGELFQEAAVSRARRSIKALLDIRPDIVTVLRDGKAITVNPQEVKIGETIQAKPGEKVALDGKLITDHSTFNTAALTGESKPDTKSKGETVFAGMINLDKISEIEVTTAFNDSKLSHILKMVQDSTARKSKTQLFISRFAKIYTPIVVLLAIAVVSLPYFFVPNYQFHEWLYRALIFLVISCPCALVISIPLGYFGGIGAASKSGILFKGSNFLDVMTKINAVVMDKTGTLTKGVFKVQKIEVKDIDKETFLNYTSLLESKSSHPVAKAIVEYHKSIFTENDLKNVEEISGHGMKGEIEGKLVLAGNVNLLQKFNISFPEEIKQIVETIVVVSIDGKYTGYIIIADELKEDALVAIQQMQSMGIKTMMLSGDKESVVKKVAESLKIDEAYGALLPEGKVEKVQSLKDKGFHIAFVGDGVNDAPVIALADAGIAMGGLGSDATIETADVVIQNDAPSKIVTAIKISKATKNIVWQNIFLAMGVKIIVLILGAGGLATMWEAVFADVGVAFLAILNAVRIQNMKFK